MSLTVDNMSLTTPGTLSCSGLLDGRINTNVYTRDTVSATEIFSSKINMSENSSTSSFKCCLLLIFTAIFHSSEIMEPQCRQ